ncbi:MAG: hypothetical protein VYB54_11305 [Pseudomonadota bacterium]|nr:hypothetical protein [Pseudomonadota bacterium]
MPILRTLLFETARRVASDPELRARAIELTRREVLPRVRVAARAAGEEVARRKARLDQDWQAARDEAGQDATRSEVAGRLVRRKFKPERS